MTDGLDARGRSPRLIRIALEEFRDCPAHEGGLTASRDPGDHGEPLQGNANLDVLQVVEAASLHTEPSSPGAGLGERSAFPAQGVDKRIVERVTRDRLPEFPDPCGASGGDHLATVPSRARAEVNDVTGSRHGFVVMFNHEE